MDFFPSFSIPVLPGAISSLRFQIPTGKLLNKFKEFTTPISPVELISQVYATFRDSFFRSHPFLQYVLRGGKYRPQDYVEECETFFYYVYQMCRGITGITLQQVTQVLDHLITIDIYERPLNPSLRDPLIPQPIDSSDEDFQVLRLSERAVLYLAGKPTLTFDVESVGDLDLVCGKEPYPTVITKNDLHRGDLICDCLGTVSVLEEIDGESNVPQQNVFGITGTPLFLGPPNCRFSPIMWRIRRGLVSNCEIRLYKRGSVWNCGLFATKNTFMPAFSTRFGQFSRGTSITISSGDELVLPFEITPTCVKSESDWRNSKSDPHRLMPKDYAPPRSKRGGTWASCGAPATPPDVPDPPPLANLFGDVTIASFILYDGSSTPGGLFPRPGVLNTLPEFGKKFWYPAVPQVRRMKQYEVPEFRSTASIQGSQSDRRPFAACHDPDCGDFVDATDADMSQPGGA
jgi:hypothetical protein